ncbi:interferon alpha-inducible protein 27-like protein 2A [Mytilus californianus]|uniref:interferon alpha-inducible protein 27-like protein 2A n=1 Tax=Mytilus californianus TaxID=6549 RepID=UPI002246591A|nr:interferon alpha-inducible protein 27-like protein 2A [Mytilus californianus]XP_052080555.1 interferon alpha-inducible protein 27-like protein 2A [Mytilus californianus]XP_052080556.1 interferon alpha-inducible protein 27-like protein 2A [Mytilus californianus]
MERRYFTVYVLFVLLITSVQGKTDQQSKKGWTWGDVWCVTKTYGGAVVIGTGAVVAVPVVLGAIGFTPAGIVAGSWAAKAMSMSATANGGAIASGGAVASLQSAAASGLSAAAKSTIGTTVGGAYRYVVGSCSKNDIDCKKK